MPTIVRVTGNHLSCEPCREKGKVKTYKNKDSFRVHFRKFHPDLSLVFEKVVTAGEPVPDADVIQEGPMAEPNQVAKDIFMKFSIQSLLDHCQFTPEGCFSIIDTIILLNYCSRDSAAKIWNGIQLRNSKLSRNDSDLVSYYKFDRESNETAVATFYNLLQIMSLLPGPVGVEITKNHANLASRIMVREQEVSCIIDHDYSTGSNPKSSEPTSNIAKLESPDANPVLDNIFMRFSIQQLSDNCRMSPEGCFSIIDTVMFLQNCLRKVASDTWYGMKSRNPRFNRNEPSLPMESKLVEYYKFDGDLITPVATFYNLLQIMSLLPGPTGDDIRKNQADLAARASAGDHDLEAALSERRDELGANGQSILLNGLSNSESARNKRQIDEEAEYPLPKRLKYTDEQLLEVAVAMCPEVKLYAVVVNAVWNTMKDDMMAFISWVQEFRDSQIACDHKKKAFTDEQERKASKHNAEEKRNDAEETRKDAEETRKVVVHAESRKLSSEMGQIQLVNETNKGKYVQDAELYRAELEAKKRGEILDAEATDRRDRSERRAGLQAGSLISIPDVRRLLELKFPKNLTGQCSHPTCFNRINATVSYIVADKNYVAGTANLAECASIVCLHHFEQTNLPIRYTFAIPKNLVELWIYRNGISTSCGLCGICGVCPLYIWSSNLEICHVVSRADGGPTEVDNLILGSRECNQQQATQSLASFSQRISSTTALQKCFPKYQLKTIRKELSTILKSKIGKDVLKRVALAVGKANSRSQNKQNLLPILFSETIVIPPSI
jgi:5-methylcytosine-specific restriction endonuclease McrA